jgi:S-DNA-T family DNA segregation ATPase FtsK/SpoIIIE
MSTDHGTQPIPDPGGDGELARVHRLPVTPPDGTPGGGDVLDGELVSDEEYERLTSQRGQALERYAYYRTEAVGVYRGVKSVVSHERTRMVMRHALWFPVAGAKVTVQRWRDAHGNGRHERMMRAAEAAGKFEEVKDWETRDAAAKQARHERVMDWLDRPIALIKAGALGLAALAGLLLVIGVVLAVKQSDAHLVLQPVGSVFDAVAFAWWAVTAYGLAALLLVTAAVLFYLWQVGRSQAEPPEWLAPPEVVKRRAEVVNLTPSIVTVAMRDLGIRVLREAIKADPDGGARMLGAITRYGPGSQVEITLPPQVTCSQIIKLRETLAGNLDRKAHEVHIEVSADSEREFVLWVADSGALDQKLPPSPMLDPNYGAVDIYRDTMPWGVDIKGELVSLNLLQQHLLLAGLSKQGKTAAARALLLWLVLDPSARLRIADLKGFGDWSMFDGLAEQLIEGAGAENFIAASDMLEWGVAEMGRRYERWLAMGHKGDIGRKDSLPGSGFEPLFLVVDEVQKLFGCSTEHPDGGEIGGNGKKARAARAAQALHDQARAVNIHFLEFAQNPNDRNLPVLVREGAMIRASLAVGTESIAKMALGEAPVSTGAAPHALRPGLDRGTVVLAPGESMDLPGGATHITVRTYFISTEQAWEIAERAKEFRKAAADQMRAKRDFLLDVMSCLGTGDEGKDECKHTDMAARLRKFAPTYEPYRRLNGQQVVEWLERESVEVKVLHGYPMVRLRAVMAVLAEREDGEVEQ